MAILRVRQWMHVNRKQWGSSSPTTQTVVEMRFKPGWGSISLVYKHLVTMIQKVLFCSIKSSIRHKHSRSLLGFFFNTHQGVLICHDEIKIQTDISQKM